MPDPLLDAIDTTTAAMAAELTAFRRDLHRWPETSGAERRTAAAVAERLHRAGLTVRTGVGGHGVVATLDGDTAGPTVAYRAELDAVDAGEDFTGDYASRVPGVAHLCGHDIHAAIGVGLAQVLARCRPRLRGRVALLFQPAEETLDGARAMIDAGVLAWTAPREMYALHCGPLPVGTFAVMPGTGLPALDRLRIEVPAGAERLATQITALSTVAFPRTAAQTRRLFDDLQVPGGPLTRFAAVRATAVGPDQVTVSVRAWPDDRRAEAADAVRRLAATVPGARLTAATQAVPALVCSAPLSQSAARYLRAAPLRATVAVLRTALPAYSDDLAEFLRHIPGALILLGAADTAAGVNGMPHTRDFAADERAIGLGVRAMAGLLVSRLDALTGV